MEYVEEILRYNISGFHQYVLNKPAHLSYVSQDLCDMLGVDEDTLLSENEDRYARSVHPEDRERYSNFIHELSLGEQKKTLQYRIIKKDGGFLYVSDTISTRKEKDGTLVGCSVLTDITQLKAENQTLQFLNETIPFGFLKYTCEKQPRVTYINDRMIEMLRIPENGEGEIDYLELYKENIYLMMPIEERRRFALYLNRVYTHDAPLVGEITVLRCDGTKGYMFGWVTKCVNEQGAEEFQSVCIDVSEMYYKKKTEEINRYLEVLTGVYDMIFEYDFSNSTVKCLYGQKSDRFKWIENIPMQMKYATEKWVNSTVLEEEREKVWDFFCTFFQKKFVEDNSVPPQIRYRALSSSGQAKTYCGVFLKIDANISLFCCRNIPDAEETELLKSENMSLKSINENMRGLVMHFTEGAAAFELNGELVTPLYASGNICKFFGFSEDEWVSMTKKKNELGDFISRSSISYEEVSELLKNGEAEFTYFDINIKEERRIRAICTPKASDDHSPRYIMLYNINDANRSDELMPPKKSNVYIRTFGYFDVFVGERPIAFRSRKSKELLALLTDRRGGYVSSEEAISFLWPEEPCNTVTLSRYRKVALRLRNILEEYGIPDIIESVDGKRRIVSDKVQCDLFDYLSGKEEFSQLFKGSYLSNYSWGESTLGALTGENIF